MGGMGKTTLLQHVYEDERINEFDLKMWVCVSNNFDAKRVIADMLESLQMKRPDLESLDAFQRRLKSEVMSKKLLLVLDDIWEEEEEEEERDKNNWENVLAPLAFGSMGSKILLTIRMDSVALMIAKDNMGLMHRISLEDDDCLQLLNNHAFANVENRDVHHNKLRSIAKEIVKKLSGSPLGAKVMGGVLNSCLNERHWIKVLNSDIGSAEFGHNDIMSILRLKLPWDYFSGMHGIGKLNSLQRLDGFYVKNKAGYRIGELEHMNELHQLRIKLLENVKDAKEACSAKLCAKRNLMDLSLEGGDVRIDNIGWKALNWKQDTSNCRNISKSILLKTLKVLRCSNIASLPLVDEIARLVALKNSTIINCHNLISLRGLQEVELTENCQFRLSKLVISGPSMLQMVPLRCINSIQKLKIKDNDELVSFPIDAEQWFLQVSSSLGELDFKRLKSLQFLPSSLQAINGPSVFQKRPLRSLSSLQKL
ncbi:hypothetical protein M5K25_018576 [Dendrobium thyrsiflorum]|uniref:Uncharacterized protein n=1 Tax=Dendrobium thyrsiflorum TaxID=117978 RepID=A0ABD0UIZ2_DENTH